MSRKLFKLVPSLLFLMTVVPAWAAPVLVDTDWLATHMNDPKVVLIDMTTDDYQYLRYHIPGAVRLDYGDLVTVRKKDRVALRLPDAQLHALLGRLGVTADRHVVIYDDMGGLNAGRLFWDLERIGHAEVSVLDGGLVRWVLEGRKVDNLPVKPRPANYQPAGAAGRANEIDYDEVRKLSEQGGAGLIDVRSRDEYVGHPRLPRSGHIPGAQWWPWENSLAIPDGFKFRAPDALRAELRTLGVEKDTPVVLYCNSGHRAAQSYLTLRQLGFDDIRLYDGSMAEYGRRKDAPLTKGLQR